MPMREPSWEMTPDGTYIFEVQLDDGTRAVVPVFPEDVDEIAGQATAEAPSPEEKRRRFQVARLLAEPELRRQLEEI
jgi:hypothetical protein